MCGHETIESEQEIERKKCVSTMPITSTRRSLNCSRTELRQKKTKNGRRKRRTTNAFASISFRSVGRCFCFAHTYNLHRLVERRLSTSPSSSTATAATTLLSLPCTHFRICTRTHRFHFQEMRSKTTKADWRFMCITHVLY